MRRRNYNLDNLPSNAMNPNKKDLTPIEMQGGIRVGRSKRTGLAYHIRTIGNSLFAELILPAIQNMTADFFIEAVSMLIFGEKRSSSRQVGRRAYHNRYRDDREESKPIRRMAQRTQSNRTKDVFEDVFFDHRESAIEVLERMRVLIYDFGVVTVGDLRSIVGLSTNITQERYGWSNLDNTKVLYTSDGYLIDFPEVEFLK